MKRKKRTQPKQSFNRVVKSAVDPRSGKKRNKKRKRKGTVWRRRKEQIYAGGLSILIVGLLVYMSSFFWLTISQVSGYSMVPVLFDKEAVLVDRRAEIKRFSLIYFQPPDHQLSRSVKRVIGLPGETIYYKNDQLFVEYEEKPERFLLAEIGKAKTEGYQLTADFTSESIIGTVNGKIPQGKYLVLGDNRTFSVDSRQYGLVDQAEIVGVVKMCVFPLHKIRNV